MKMKAAESGAQDSNVNPASQEQEKARTTLAVIVRGSRGLGSTSRLLAKAENTSRTHHERKYQRYQFPPSSSARRRTPEEFFSQPVV